jgi:hypothetical protein
LAGSGLRLLGRPSRDLLPVTPIYPTFIDATSAE